MIDVRSVATPLGPFAIATRGDVVVTTSWTNDVAGLMASRGIVEWQSVSGASASSDAVRDYFDGHVAALDSVVVEQSLGAFLDSALVKLRAVAPGTTITYSELARRAGRPSAVRAAGSACARNRIPLFVPCHRVVRFDGSLGGFYFGLDAKRLLLNHEAQHLFAPGARTRRDIGC